MAVDNVPERLLQTCVAYQREVALIHLDTPPGDMRPGYACAERLVTHAACTPDTTADRGMSGR